MAFDFEDVKDMAKQKPWLVYGGLAVAGVFGFLALRRSRPQAGAPADVYVPSEYPSGGGGGSFGGGGGGEDLSAIGFGMDQLAAFTQRQSEITLAAIDTMQRQYHEDIQRLREDMDRDRTQTLSQVQTLATTQSVGFSLLNQGLEEALTRESYQVPSYYNDTPAPTTKPATSPAPSPVYVPEPVYSAPSPVQTSVSSQLLYQGSSGADVRGLQEQLTALGYNLGSVDGIFGPKTAAALRQFQSDMGIGVDAIAGPETYGALATATSRTTTQSTSQVASPLGPFREEAYRPQPVTQEPDYSYGGLPRTSKVRE